jgi:hypothetical protein
VALDAEQAELEDREQAGWAGADDDAVGLGRGSAGRGLAHLGFLDDGRRLQDRGANFI